MEEIWKDIEGDYKGLYQASNLGRVRSLDRYDSMGRLRKGKIIKPWNNGYGYLVVDLKKNGKRKHFFVHRLVAFCFIPNPNNYPCINHRDRNPQNNISSNLEWVTHHLNNSYLPTVKYKSEVMTNRSDMSKPVLQLTQEGWLFKEWPSTNEIERELGYFATIIAECCRGNGRRKSAYGFKWMYKEKAA